MDEEVRWDSCALSSAVIFVMARDWSSPISMDTEHPIGSNVDGQSNASLCGRFLDLRE